MVKIAATIKDVAKYTGLSIATISKYINGGNVLEHNKKIIDEAIDVLNFRVNEMARGLKTNRSKTIGILIPNLEKVFCTSIVSNIENILIKHGYSTVICDYKEDINLEKEKLKFLVNKSRQEKPFHFGSILRMRDIMISMDVQQSRHCAIFPESITC